MAFNVNQFRSQLQGDGARPNLFEVSMPFPAFSLPGNAQTKMTFMCKTAQLPGSTLGVVPVQYFGRELKFVGNRTFADWTVTIINDTEMSLRKPFEEWMNGMNDLELNTGVLSPTDYQVDLIVEHLDRNDEVLMTYTLYNAFPINMSEIALQYGQNDVIEEFTVTFNYSHYLTDAL